MNDRDVQHNALHVFWIAIDTDFNKAAVLCEAPLLFQIVNNMFCLAFTIEIIVRFMADIWIPLSYARPHATSDVATPVLSFATSQYIYP